MNRGQGGNERSHRSFWKYVPFIAFEFPDHWERKPQGVKHQQRDCVAETLTTFTFNSKAVTLYSCKASQACFDTAVLKREVIATDTPSLPSAHAPSDLPA